MSVLLLVLCATAAAVEEVDYYEALDADNLYEELEDLYKLNSVELNYDPKDDRIKRFNKLASLIEKTKKKPSTRILKNQTAVANELIARNEQLAKNMLDKVLPENDINLNDTLLNNTAILNQDLTNSTSANIATVTNDLNNEEYVNQTSQNVETEEGEVIKVAVKVDEGDRPPLDVVALLDLIANLTADYDSNLTSILNETLHNDFEIPTCEPKTSTTTKPTKMLKPGQKFDYYDESEINGTGEHISSCYVCGLEADGIPKQSVCGDAFAGDFLPLVPLDASARGYLARFRKYCKVMQVPNFYMPKDDRRSMWGRWTGGCAVRWTDLSGVYTQRTCRNKDRAVTGKHIASKRMAKLEMALKHTDNGCIVSPVASLLPLSRGISLYARFYACVCTGDFCNSTTLLTPSVNVIIYVLILNLLMHLS